MHRAFSFILVVLLIVALAVPAFASETFPDVVVSSDYPYYAIYYNSYDNRIDLIITQNPIFYDGSDVLDSDGLNFKGSMYTLSSDGMTWEYVKSFNSSSICFVSEVYEIGNTFATCDGSECPATDTNYDGICDDCGARLMNLVRTPTAPDVVGNNKNFVMFYTGEIYYYTAYTSDNAYSIRGYYYGSRMRTTSDITVNVQRFTSYDGLNWQSEYNDKAKDYYPGEQGWTLLSSSFNWYDSSENTSDPFFPVPLWVEVEKVTQGEMVTVQTETAQTMGFLMACGIGCLALLIILSLFGKRCLIYRG